MNLRVSRIGFAALVVFLVAATAIFVYLMGRFGGPAIKLSEPYAVTAVFGDAQGLAAKSDVLVRGVKVGEVQDIAARDGKARVRFSVDAPVAPMGRAATVRVGQKTLLGEAYLDLEPGSARAARVPRDGTLPPSRVLPSIELDEALEAFDEETQEHIQSMLATFRRGARPARTADRVNATLGRLDALTGGLRDITELLRGQERTIAGGVVDGRRVLEAIGRHETQISQVVSTGRSTLSALASRQSSLDAGLRELPRLLGSAQRTLADARPLLVEGRPLLRELRQVAPDLTPALEDLRPVARDARDVVAGLPALERAALPTLDLAEPAVAAARPVARLLEPALANLVAIVRYLEPRSNTLAAWFSNTADLGLNGDAKGDWARFFIFVEPGTSFGSPAGASSNNAYTAPDDAAHNQPYRPGSYPRLLPFKP